MVASINVCWKHAAVIILWLFCIGCNANDEDPKPQPPVPSGATSLDKDLDPNERLERKFEELQTQILDLQQTVAQQQSVIQDLNQTLTSVVFAADEYGVIYDQSDDRPLLMTSAHAHDVPFVMLNVIAVRLPKRDAYYQPDKKGKRERNKKFRPGSMRKTRYAHVMVTLSRDGIYQLWDDDQNELHTYFDPSVLLPGHGDVGDWSADELVDSRQNFAVHSDVITQTKFGNTWFVMARDDASFVKVYSIAAWRDFETEPQRNDGNAPTVKRSMIAGQITAENTIHRPSPKELTLKLKQAKNKKGSNNKMMRNRQQQQKPKEKDVNEFDDAAEGKGEKNSKQECASDKEGGECAAASDTASDTASETAAAAAATKEASEEVDADTVVVNATVTGVVAYQYQKKRYIAVSYSDGKLFAYSPSGQLSSTAGTMPWTSPNATIAALAITGKKFELLAVTEAGFQFLKLPRMQKTGPFCNLPADTTVNSVKFDVINERRMYLGTTDGRLLVFNVRKLNKKMCKPVDSFTVHPQSRLQIEATSGYLLVSSSLGLHVYNVSEKKTAGYSRPGLLFVQRFDEEFGSNDDRLSNSNVLVSSYTDTYKRTVIAYAQSASNVSVQETDVQYRFVVLESYLPTFVSATDKGGLLGILKNAPIFAAVGICVFMWLFFKGKGGGGGGALGKSPLGRLFNRGGKRRPASQPPSDANNMMENWRERHPDHQPRSNANKKSKNMSYGQKQAKSYRRTLGGNISD